MHDIEPKKGEVNLVDEGAQLRLYSWLVLCNNRMNILSFLPKYFLIILDTVLSFHETPSGTNSTAELKLMRSNTLSVLSQLSKFGHDGADPISLQTVRQALKPDDAHSEPGVEGASLLFYYLFDDWRAVYLTVAKFRQRLDILVRPLTLLEKVFILIIRSELLF